MQANRPFLFMACSELRQTLGEEADDEKRLVELLETVPLDSIYFHTHSYFLRHSYVERVYPNDFAQWVAMEVRDHVLGERLSVIDDHLSKTPIVPRVIFGEPFYFNKSLILQVPTRMEVRTLQEFRNALSEVEVSAIYFHVFEARHRLRHEDSDFSAWIQHGLGMPELADKLRTINPYLGSLERVRSALLTVCDEFLT